MAQYGGWKNAETFNVTGWIESDGWYIVMEGAESESSDVLFADFLRRKWLEYSTREDLPSDSADQVDWSDLARHYRRVYKVENGIPED